MAHRVASGVPEAAAARRLRGVYTRLLACYGPQRWWPAGSAFEMMVGAVLVQNTAWRNVEPAIENLRASGGLDWRRLHAFDQAALAAAVRPSGTFRVKARRLTALASFVFEAGGPAALARRATIGLRADLLAVHGVGEESADAILCYAFGRPCFVMDAYTRRVCSRLGVVDAGDGRRDAWLRQRFEQALGRDAAACGECHALLVAHAKAHCRVRPRCRGCPLRRGCLHARLGKAL